jgi:hypothetical protein
MDFSKLNKLPRSEADFVSATRSDKPRQTQPDQAHREAMEEKGGITHAVNQADTKGVVGHSSELATNEGIAYQAEPEWNEPKDND